MYSALSRLLDPLLILLLVTAVAVANLWRKRVERKGRLLWATVSLAALAVLTTPAVAHLATGTLKWRYPPRFSRPLADAIVVLSGYAYLCDETGKQAELGDDTLVRCLKAARLYHQGPPRLVAVSGGKIARGQSDLTLAGVMHDFLLTQGITDTDLLVEDRSTTTYENARDTAPILRKRGIRKIILVTDSIRMARAEACFATQGFEVVPWPCRHHAARLERSVFSFLPNSETPKNLKLALHEWIGLVWYKLTGKI